MYYGLLLVGVSLGPHARVRVCVCMCVCVCVCVCVSGAVPHHLDTTVSLTWPHYLLVLTQGLAVL